MATVRELLAWKGTEMVSIAPTASVVEAALRMNERGVDGLLVTGAEQELVGIFTERDILRRIVAAGRSAATTTVREVMTTAVPTCLPETSVEACGAIITTQRIQHLPVVDAHGLVHGVVTGADVLAHRVAEQEATIHYLNSYMFDLR